MKKTLYILYLFTLINFLLGEQMIVVGEVFTESWWPYCPDARAGISDLADAQPNFIPLIFQGDTQYASPGYASRFNQYGGSGLPLAQFGGYLSVSGGGGGIIPVGGIIIWSGSTGSIPSGWAICNGSNGSPDLRNRFIVATGSSYSINATGGSNSVSLSTAQMPSHDHDAGATVNDPGHKHQLKGGVADADFVYGTLSNTYAEIEDITTNEGLVVQTWWYKYLLST